MSRIKPCKPLKNTEQTSPQYSDNQNLCVAFRNKEKNRENTETFSDLDTEFAENDFKKLENLMLTLVETLENTLIAFREIRQKKGMIPTHNLTPDNQNYLNFRDNESNKQQPGEIECKFCKKQFHRKNIGRHVSVCRLAKDPVRLLEIDLGVEYQHPDPSGKECKYCNKVFCRPNYLNKHLVVCSLKKEYHQKLLNQKNKEHELPVINSAVINSGEILNFGDTLDNVTDQEIIDSINSIINDHSSKYEKVFNMAGDIVIKYDQLLNKQNKNYKLSSYRSQVAQVKLNNCWERVDADIYLQKLFKYRALLLFNRISIGSSSTFDFINSEKSKLVNGIFTEIKHFAQHGFEHKGFVNGYVSYSDRRSIKSKFKISKLN